MEKLRDKKQSEAQLQRAAHTVSLYFEMQKDVELQILKKSLHQR